MVLLGGSKGSLTSPCSGPAVSEIGTAPLQQALRVTVPYFLDWNEEVHQPTRCVLPPTEKNASAHSMSGR